MSNFRARARTLDMLGRQQIAGIPTAISELFKNAHDAYARNVEIDYYRTDALFVLRDDGMGMTHKEFLERWLIIGTESKLRSGAMPSPAPDPGQKKRPMLGEKGIGRLAIATLGPQVLVITRGRREGAASDLTAAFVNWTLFECPGIDLEDIPIPVRQFPGGRLPSRDDVSAMLAEFTENTDRLKSRIGEAFHTRIRDQLGVFHGVDPGTIDSYLGNPTLTGDGTGTHFIIVPASDLLPADIEGEANTGKATPLKKALLGFTNTMTPEHPAPVIRTAFRYHGTEDATEELISGEEFFTVQEYSNSDHTVTGSFDEYGQFVGTVAIYAEDFHDHVIPWRGTDGKRTACGPFSIGFAAIEADGKHSTLPPEDHLRMTRKMEQIGGLYIYRDSVRVLPYGEPEYDWLDIEAQRSKHASYYYFSHRKMFGVIEIDSGKNSGLEEKAGREGFRENLAYRQFKRILKNFLLQMAADFFRTGGVHGGSFEETKEHLEKTERDRRHREKLVSVRKAQLSTEMAEFFQRLASEGPASEVERLVAEVKSRVDAAGASSEPERAAEEIVAIEKTALRDLAGLESGYRIRRPRIGLSKALQREWRHYAATFAELVAGVFDPGRREVEGAIAERTAAMGLAVDRRRLAAAALEEAAFAARRETRRRRNEVRAEVDRVSRDVLDAVGECVTAVEREVRGVVTDFERLDITGYSDEAFVEIRSTLESRIVQRVEERTMVLDSLAAQLAGIDATGESSALDQLVAIEQRNVLLEEEADADLQLAQLGMAVEIINHEFGATVRSLRNNLRRLKAWADVNDGIRELYHNIRASFDHLDGYLTLFTPLQRRLYRKPVEMRGEEIFEFLRDLFRDRLTRHDIEFVRTAAFARASLRGFPSSFYPVFVNLVDNAIYWLAQQNPGEKRRIELDAKGGELLVTDTGPGVAGRDKDVIFEFGFTRKAGGRGMGLHICRETLRRVDYELVLGEKGGGGGATFVVRPRPQGGGEIGK